MSDDKRNEILEKVRALLAKAASTHSEEEAESCARLANKLLEKYNLEMTDLKDPEDDQAVGEERMQEMYSDPWRSAIVKGACRLYFCSFFHGTWFDQAGWAEAKKAHRELEDAYLKKHGKRHWEYEDEVADGWYEIRKKAPEISVYSRPSFAIVGRPHNRAVCIEMIRYLWDTTRRLSRDYSKVRREKLAFQRGCGERLGYRLTMMAFEAERQAPKVPGTHVTIYGQFQKENEDLMATLGLVKRKSGSSNLDSEHAAAGDRAGQTVSLAPQVGSGSRSAATALPAPPKALPDKRRS